MHLTGPIRAPERSLTPFGMCRSTHPPFNSRSFCTYKTTSHLHIPHLLKVPQFQRLAQKQYLTPLSCADTRIGRGGTPCGHSGLTGGVPKLLSFQWFTHSQFPRPFIFSNLHTPGQGGRGKDKSRHFPLASRSAPRYPRPSFRIGENASKPISLAGASEPWLEHLKHEPKAAEPINSRTLPDTIKASRT